MFSSAFFPSRIRPLTYMAPWGASVAWLGDTAESGRNYPIGILHLLQFYQRLEVGIRVYAKADLARHDESAADMRVGRVDGAGSYKLWKVSFSGTQQ